MEYRGPEYYIPLFSLEVQLSKRDLETIRLILQQQMIYVGCVFEHSFFVQAHELLMDFIGYEGGIIILDSRGLS